MHSIHRLYRLCRPGNPDDLNFVGRSSLSAWVKPAATGGLRNIIEHGYRLSPNQEVGLPHQRRLLRNPLLEQGAITAKSAIPAGDLNTWVHLTGQHDGTTWRLFRNGVQVAQSVDSVGCILVGDNWAVGARGTGTERFFQGGIDDVMVWNRALSTTEIRFLYTNGLAA